MIISIDFKIEISSINLVLTLSSNKEKSCTSSKLFLVNQISLKVDGSTR